MLLLVLGFGSYNQNLPFGLNSFMGSNGVILTCRDNEQLSKYGDTKSARGIMLVELKKLIEANPLFRDKHQFPTLKNSRLRTLINQRSL